MILRDGGIGDLEALVGIFNHYIATSNARFESEAMSLDQGRRWMQQFERSRRYRLCVAEAACEVAGFACTQVYRPGPAFEDTVEVTVYLADGRAGQGLGSRLYQTLFSSLPPGELHRALAGIALPNDTSIALHKKFGFTEVGVFNEYAKKKGQRISSLWLEKRL
ncbi:MAG: GNAT family N-acetyltransferase [Rhodospirillales bacterium]